MRPRIGLLLLYLELYDQVLPELRDRLSCFSKKIADGFKKKGIFVITSEICRLKEEFGRAIRNFEAEDVDAIVTLHLAYSPSLECAHILAKTDKPLIVLDTTPDYSFNIEAGPDDIMANHGIHGVQDLCNMLIRLNKDFFIEAGHWKDDEALDRAAARIRGALAAKNFKNSKIGSIGGYFKGMGDFSIDSESLSKTFGLQTIYFDPKQIKDIDSSIDASIIEKESEELKKKYKSKLNNEESLPNSVKSGLIIRKWVKDNNLNGFSFNFSKTDRKMGFKTLPFMEAGLSMARGIGYAGEGDVLTACLVGALSRVFSKTTFTEMFCPDWKGGSIFLSHMGEANPDLLAEPLMVEKEIPFIDTEDPVLIAGRFKPGPAILANLAPLGGDKYRFLVCEGKMLEVDNRKLKDTIRGWFKPNKRVPDFLEDYSQYGGTHHLAMVYGDLSREMSTLGRIMGWEVINI